MRFDIRPCLTIGVFFLLLTFPEPGFSEDNLPTGHEIVLRINAREEGNSVARKVTMELIDSYGKRRIRETFGFRKYFGEEKRAVIFYLAPRDIKGTAFLVYDYPDAEQEDDQWLYLPALRRVRRISASKRGGYFLGTDFTYDEIKNETNVAIEDYIYKTLGVEKIDEFKTYLVEAIPLNHEIGKELGYNRVLLWVDAEIWIIRQSKFWDMQGKLLKTESFQEIKPVEGVWTVHRMEAENHKTKHKTRFTFKDIHYNTSMPDDVFTTRAIQHGFKASLHK